MTPPILSSDLSGSGVALSSPVWQVAGNGRWQALAGGACRSGKWRRIWRKHATLPGGKRNQTKRLTPIRTLDRRPRQQPAGSVAETTMARCSEDKSGQSCR